MNVENTPPPGYSETRCGWARIDCADCRGRGEVVVTDDEEPELRYPQPCDCLSCPETELERELENQDNPARRAEIEHELYHQRITRRQQQIAVEIGPRQPGHRYWDGYGRRAYTVETITITYPEGDLTRPSWSITVRWDDGHRTTHCTPWDPELGDRQAPPERRVPRSRIEKPCPHCTSRSPLTRAAHWLGLH